MHKKYGKKPKQTEINSDFLQEMCPFLNTDASLLPESLSLMNSEESQFGQLGFMSKEEVNIAKGMTLTDICPN